MIPPECPVCREPLEMGRTKVPRYVRAVCPCDKLELGSEDSWRLEIPTGSRTFRIFIVDPSGRRAVLVTTPGPGETNDAYQEEFFEDGAVTEELVEESFRMLTVRSVLTA